MKRLNRNSNDPPLRPSDDPANDAVYRGPEIKCGSYSYPMNLTRIFIVCSTGLFFVFFSLSAILWDSSSDAIFGVAEARVLELKPQQQQQGTYNLILSAEFNLINFVIIACIRSFNFIYLKMWFGCNDFTVTGELLYLPSWHHSHFLFFGHNLIYQIL